MTEEELFDVLDKFPKIVNQVKILADAVSKNNQTTTDNVAVISRVVCGQEERLSKVEQQLSALAISIESAKSQMQKEVTVKFPPIPDVKIKRSDFTVYAEHTDAEMEKVAETVAEKVFVKKSSFKSFFNTAVAMIFFCMVILGVLFIKQNNDYRSWMDRAIDVGIVAGDMHPGDRGVSVKNEFKKGRKARTAKKAEIKALEERYDKIWEENAQVLKKAVSSVLLTDIVVLDYSLADIDSTSYNALVKYRLEDSEAVSSAHICKNGDIYVTQDTDINTVQEAERYSARKTWRLAGNRFHIILK